MIKSSIKITSKGQGWEEKFSADCLVERQSGASRVTVFYKNDGDECRLVLENGAVKMSRKGKTFLDMVFKSGERTVCLAGDGGLRCELECFTTFLEIKNFAHGTRLKLKYTLSDSPVSLEAVIVYGL